MKKVRGSPALHLIDRYAGIPTVALLGGLRRKRRLPDKIETIGLLKGGAIGDTVLLSGVIHDLRAAFPDAKLVLFVGESNHEIAQFLEGVDQLVIAPMGDPRKGFRAMRSVPLDVMIDFAQWSRAEALYALASDAKFKIGFRTAGQHRHFGFDRIVEHAGDGHEIENYRRLLHVLGAKTGQPPRLRSSARIEAFGEPYVVCHLWPGGRRKERKQWPSENWIKLLEEFAAQGFHVVLTGGPDDTAANANILKQLSSAARVMSTDFAGASLPDTLSLLSHAQLVVSVDTGIMHIASALGVPLVALHGPTSSTRWGPLSKKAIAIDTPHPEGGYISLGWEDRSPAPPCMEMISFESVRQACKRLLAQVSIEDSLPLSDRHVEVLRKAQR
jgi:heptosyltransferase III